MPEAIGRFYRVFADEVGWCVAAITGGNRAMRRFEPAVKLFPHDVAIGARRRIVRQVRPAFLIGESICANTDSDADNHSENDAVDGSKLHARFIRILNRSIEYLRKPPSGTARTLIPRPFSSAHKGSPAERPGQPRKAGHPHLRRSQAHARRPSVARYRRSRQSPT